MNTAPNVRAQQTASSVTTYTLPDTAMSEFQNAILKDSITNDRKFLIGGTGSDLWHGAADATNEYWMLTDRGPNGQIPVGDETRRTFPVPEFDPTILHVSVADGAIKIIASLPILTASGAPVTGLSNRDKYDETPYDFSAQTLLEFNQNGLDSEGLVRTSAGEFWLADEYSPSILHIGADGKVIKRYVPEGITLDATDYPVAATLPAIYGKRKINRGFEGIAISADEKTLFVVLQSPLSNPDKKVGDASRTTRVIAFDVASEAVTAEYAYWFDEASTFGEGTKPADLKLSSVVVVNPTTLLINERTDAVAKLYLVDLSKATNLLSSKWDAAATSPALEGVEDLAASEVTVLPKTLLIDLSTIEGMPGKIEGVAIVDKSTIAVANDNDFGVGDVDADGNNIDTGVKSQLLEIKLAQPLP